MLLGFKRRFAPFVLDGSKRHTIRAKRKTPPKIGEICHCYVDPRQKSMKLLGRWPCVKVEDIRIYERRLLEPGDAWFGVAIEGVELSQGEKDMLAWRDGFRNPVKRPRINAGLTGCFDMMMAFWMETHGNAKRTGPFVFEGDIVHWDFERPVTQKVTGGWIR